MPETRIFRGSTFGEGSPFRLAPREGLDSSNRTGSQKHVVFDTFRPNRYFRVPEIDATLAFQVQNKIPITSFLDKSRFFGRTYISRSPKSTPLSRFRSGKPLYSEFLRKITRFRPKIYVRVAEIDAFLAFQVQNKCL